MKITSLATLHCNAGWRDYSFVRIRTDTGITGWSEYMEGYGSPGLTAVIERLGQQLIGADPRPVERLVQSLRAWTRHAPGGIGHQAIGAIENALIDVKARDLGIPVAALFGGPIRDRLPVYWSHCGSYRLEHHEVLGAPPLTSLDGVRALGREVRDKGFRALKTNIFLFDRDPPDLYMPGFGRSEGGPERNLDDVLLTLIVDQMTAFREGAGPSVGLMLDTNFNFRTEGYIRLARALAPLDLTWLELDLFDPDGTRRIRDHAPMPIASLESLFGRTQYKPYLDARAVDVAIVDVPWNGIMESVRVAALAETCEINCAAHNFNGHLGSLMSAHFCAAIPNFRIMEIDVEDVPWRDDLVTPAPVIEDGCFLLPDGPGWGAELNEAALAAHPPAGRPWIGESG